jgi:drug/metabolite transporter (DMT)-like permease
MNVAAIVGNIGALSIAENTALYSIKRYENDPKSQLKFYVLGALIYGILVPYFLLRSLKYEGLGTVNFFWNVVSTVSAFAIGAYLFKEKISNWKIMGVTLSMVGLGMILLSDKDQIEKT